MNTTKSIFLLVCLCLSAFAVNAQQQITFTGGEFVRDNYNPLFGSNGTFHFVGANTDINGRLVGSSSSGVYAFCDMGNPRCMPGSTFTVVDFINGSTAFRDNITPVTVNGTVYKTMRYSNSSLRLDAGTVRIPWSVAKRRTFKLTYKVHVTGNFNGTSPPLPPVFTSIVDLWGTVTVSFVRDDSGRYPFPSLNYVMTGVSYNIPAPGN